MKIVCDSCSTKYSISDDKVRGKVFKIRCKKCSHIIVVRGTGEGAPAAAEAPADAVWHLVVDGDQVGPLSDAEVRARLSRGEISAENYIWKEGFADWLRLVDVPEFADVAAGSGSASAGGDLFSDPAPISTATPVGSIQAASGRISGRHATVGEQESFFGGGAGAGGQDAPRSTRTSGRMRAVEA
ncbi:MAG TPA: GYF domain-containing protein, partial [Polyangia bacterium]